ncbi:hypothetical protein Tco_1349338 [Tanacetum coccineum]
MMKLNSLTKNPQILMMKMKLLKSLGPTLMYLILRHLCVGPSRNLIIFYKSIQICLPKILRDLRLTKIRRMIGFMNGMKMCHGCMKNHGRMMEYEKNPLELNIIDGKLKDKALKNKANVEGIIDEDDESHNEGWRRWDGYKNTIHDHEEREHEEERVDPTSIDRIP